MHSKVALKAAFRPTTIPIFPTSSYTLSPHLLHRPTPFPTSLALFTTPRPHFLVRLVHFPTFPNGFSHKRTSNLKEEKGNWEGESGKGPQGKKGAPISEVALSTDEVLTILENYPLTNRPGYRKIFIDIKMELRIMESIDAQSVLYSLQSRAQQSELENQLRTMEARAEAKITSGLERLRFEIGNGCLQHAEEPNKITKK
ncbi:hypothetical protein B9Z19DRAFT_1066944 [Tuber borchii]|uniref:Uncharacterized protein n=1 Tax=Tuber borchii TaxID=42251 RepID=A0A2T6ZKW0_TUBBO|nr:hypothetical protein B9Z19DRAFT_1066944 [Tuber borchii]